ncbi:MAG: O-acetyl-ADP-ribose deacetylase [Acidobacteria bacterium]|nr:O-acetyl-ADP-ribose deacetylase [Acidobacteriota bacterium]
MPVTKFKTFEEARRALDGERPDEAYSRRLAVLWEVSGSLCPLKVRRGVEKFRTSEEAFESRRRWVLEPITSRPGSPAADPGLTATIEPGCRIELAEGDITLQDTDAVVNAANSSLTGGGGVDGAIHAAGGPAILEDCRRVVARLGRLPAGQAAITTGGRLKARHVIHTVGPVWRGGAHGEPEALASCYRESLKTALDHNLSSVAFPSVSTGIYGYPVEKAAAVALQTVRDFLLAHGAPPLVRFVLYDPHTFRAYAAALEIVSRG